MEDFYLCEPPEPEAAKPTSAAQAKLAERQLQQKQKLQEKLLKPAAAGGKEQGKAALLKVRADSAAIRAHLDAVVARAPPAGRLAALLAETRIAPAELEAATVGCAKEAVATVRAQVADLAAGRPLRYQIAPALDASLRRPREVAGAAELDAALAAAVELEGGEEAERARALLEALLPEMEPVLRRLAAAPRGEGPLEASAAAELALLRAALHKEAEIDDPHADEVEDTDSDTDAGEGEGGGGGGSPRGGAAGARDRRAHALEQLQARSELIVSSARDLKETFAVAEPFERGKVGRRRAPPPRAPPPAPPRRPAARAAR